MTSSPTAITAVPDASDSGPGATAPGAGVVARRRDWRRHALNVAGVTPFFIYVGLGLVAPIVSIVILALHNKQGHLTTHNLTLLTTGIYKTSFYNSLRLAITASVIPCVIGVFVAYALASLHHPVVVRLTAAAAGVLANFGGVPLAFIFVAAYGYVGITTRWLAALGFNPWDHGFNLYSFTGVVFIYCYFQIPLMVLVITPAFGALKTQWREAAAGLGANAWSYWRRIGVPVLMPSILGGLVLLFGSAFSAYATADVLTSGGVNIAPILIGDFLDGNVVAGQENVGYAIGVGMIAILLVVTGLYLLARRRSSRWLRL